MLQLVLLQACVRVQGNFHAFLPGDTFPARRPEVRVEAFPLLLHLGFRDSPQTLFISDLRGRWSGLLAEAGRGFPGGVGVGQGHGEMGPQGPRSPALSALIASAAPAAGAEWFPSDLQAEGRREGTGFGLGGPGF